MEKKEQNIVVISILAAVIVILLAVIVGGMFYVRKVHLQLAQMQTALRHRGIITMVQAGQMPQTPGLWSSSDSAASDSVEGKLRAKGKRWVEIPGEITVGSYVQDTLEGRMGQPEGRGAIAKVLEVNSDPNVTPAAKVDFGRGYITGVNLAELSLVAVKDR